MRGQPPDTWTAEEVGEFDEMMSRLRWRTGAPGSLTRIALVLEQPTPDQVSNAADSVNRVGGNLIIVDCRRQRHHRLTAPQTTKSPVSVLSENFDSVSHGFNAAFANVTTEYFAATLIGDFAHWRFYLRLLRRAWDDDADLVIGTLAYPRFTPREVLEMLRIGARRESLPTEATVWSISNLIIRADFWRRHVGVLPNTSSPFVEALTKLRASQPHTSIARSAKFSPAPLIRRRQVYTARNDNLVMDGLALREKDTLYRFIIERCGMNLTRWAQTRSDAERQYVASTLKTVWRRTSQAAVGSAFARGRLLTYLAATNRWVDADRVDELFARFFARPPTYPAGGKIIYDLSDIPGAPIDIPESLRALGRRESPHIAELHTAYWSSEATLSVSGWSYLRGLDTHRGTYSVRLALVNGAGSIRTLPVVSTIQPWADRWTKDPHASYAASGFETEIDFKSLTDAIPESSEREAWELQVSLEFQSTIHQTSIRECSQDGSARFLKPRFIPEIARVVELVNEPDKPIQITLSRGPIAVSGGREQQVVVNSIHYEGDRLTIRAKTVCVTESFRNRDWQWELCGPYRISGSSQYVNGHIEVTFDLSANDHFGHRCPVPPARLSVAAKFRGGHIAVIASSDFARRLPIRMLSRYHAMQPTLSDDQSLIIILEPPLQFDEVGVNAQQRLRSRYLADSSGPLDAVLFQCYQGEFAADSQLPIFHEIRRRRPDATVYWSVSSLATTLPAGATPLVIGSREWYQKLSRVRYICHNSHFPRYFRKRSHQRFLQTFHGYPVKNMGRAYMEHTGSYSQWQIQQHLDRHNSSWDAITVPSSLVAQICRTEYEFDGELLMTGYPRNDPILGADAHKTRRRVRAALGIPEGITVVLYAPTWRESLAISSLYSRAYRGLDLSYLANALGPTHLVLARGHDYNLRAGDTFSDIQGVIDLTAYPDVNDLILAADIALLDYSSLRFDWALTGKPMVFYTPDFEEYVAKRGFLLPFSETAPGPIVRDMAELADALSNPSQIQEGYAREIFQFNSVYNPFADGHAAERTVDQFFAEFTR